MRFKIDENLPPESTTILRNNGHEALTVWNQKLQGRSDAKIASVCQEERRVFITLDLDFADIRAYPPDQFAGLIVLRLNSQSRSHVLHVLEELSPLFKIERVEGRLWVVDESTVRIHGEGEDGN